MVKGDAGRCAALAQSLARVAARSLCWLEIGTPTGRQWHLAEELTAGRGDALRSRLEALSQRLGGRLDVAASVLAESCARPVALAAAGAFFLDQRVPHVSAGGIRLHIGPEECFDAVALDPATGMTVLGGDAASACSGVDTAGGLAELRNELAHHLVGSLTPVVAAIHGESSKRTAALWGTVGHAIATSLMILGRATCEQQRASAEADLVLEAASPPLRGPPAWFAVGHGAEEHLLPCRSTCCLARRIPGLGQCSTCPLLGYHERMQRLRACSP